MENQGWIKLHRKLKNKEYYNKPCYLALWVHLLLSANHKNQKFMWNGNVIIIKDGQFLTGRKQLSQETGIPETTIERALDYFEKNGHQIEQQKTTKYRIITVLNWHTHQQEDIKTDNKRTTNGQQTDTNKNDNNDKNEKKEISNAIALQENEGIVNQKEISEIIYYFREIDEIGYKKWFAVPPERRACEELLKRASMGDLQILIEKYLPYLNSLAYSPKNAKAFKPSELNRNWAVIKAKLKEIQTAQTQRAQQTKIKIMK